jgi:hypothetical protein
MRYARIQDGRVAEIIVLSQDGPPLSQLYHPDIVAACVLVGPDEVAEGWSYVDGAFSPPAADNASLPARIRAIAPFAFRQRLPAATRRAVTLAASQAMEAGDATLQTWLDDLSSTRVVLLDHPEIASGVAMLRTAGLITEAQAAALLADGTAEEV